MSEETETKGAGATLAEKPVALAVVIHQAVAQTVLPNVRIDREHLIAGIADAMERGVPWVFEQGSVSRVFFFGSAAVVEVLPQEEFEAVVAEQQRQMLQARAQGGPPLVVPGGFAPGGGRRGRG
jgi:hypothetical protein